MIEKNITSIHSHLRQVTNKCVFSIIVPVLNEADQINATIEHLCNENTEGNCEIVVVDGDPGGGTIKKAINHKGYALVDVFQPCVTFNKLNTYQWFKDNTYYLEDSFDYHDRNLAFNKATKTDKLPLGVFYINSERTPFEENIGIYEQDNTPLFERDIDYIKLESLIGRFALT